MTGRRFEGIVGLLLLLLVSGMGGDDEDTAPLPESHHRMVAVLQRIAEQIDLEDPWLGNKAVLELRERHQNLKRRVPAWRRWRLSRQLGNEELRLGHYERAVELLAEAERIARQPDSEVKPENVVQTSYDLGVAWLRRAETENCVERNCCQSCILPFEAQAVHQLTEGSEGAMAAFGRVLDDDPEHVAALWLYNVAAMTLGLYPDQLDESRRIPPEVFEGAKDFPALVNVAPDLGLDTFNLSGGVIVDDFDGDEDLDIVTSTFDKRGPLLFFRNQGSGQFSDESESSHLSDLLGGLNLVPADYDNDGHLDFLVLRGAWLGPNGRQPNSLVRNLGNGRFADVTFDAGLADVSYPTQTAAWADYDLDGDLDLYIGNENRADRGYPNQLFQNQGDGTFVDVAKQAGVEDLRFTKGVIWGDHDGDRDPDLYVSNLGDPNRLYRNEGDGTFTDVAPELGVHLPTRSFPTWFFDPDNDGDLDLYVSSYCASLDVIAASHLGRPHDGESMRLYRNNGDGTFVDATDELGLALPTAAMGANFADLDSDGWTDFYLGTGYPAYDGLMPNMMYRNRQGQCFDDVTSIARVGHLQKGHGIAFGDLDSDGDLDLFAQMGGAFPGDGFANALFQNPGRGHHLLAVRLHGVQSNRSAIGARITAHFTEHDTERTVTAWVTSGGSFGANPLRQSLGLGQAQRVNRLVVDWPTSHTTQVFEDVAAGQLIHITEGRDELRATPFDQIGR